MNWQLLPEARVLLHVPRLPFAGATTAQEAPAAFTDIGMTSRVAASHHFIVSIDAKRELTKINLFVNKPDDFQFFITLPFLSFIVPEVALAISGLHGCDHLSVPAALTRISDSESKCACATAFARDFALQNPRR